MAEIHIRLLGECDIRSAANSHLRFRLKKTKILLTYLALQLGEPASREKLSNLLWSDRGTKQARASLRQALSELRQVLGSLQAAPIKTDSINVVLDPSVTEVDACTFVQLSRLNEEASLQAAADLYNGTFCDGVDAGCPAFEEWIDKERRAYRGIAVDTLKKLLAFNVSADRREKAIPNAEKLLSLDPLDETTHRTLMKLYAADGMSNKAMQKFRYLQALLKRELNVTPEPETFALMEQIRNDRLSGETIDPLIGSDKRKTRAGISTVENVPPKRSLSSRFTRNSWPLTGGGMLAVALGAGLALVLAMVAYKNPVSHRDTTAKPLTELETSEDQNGSYTRERAAFQVEPEFSIVDAVAVENDTLINAPVRILQSTNALAEDAFLEGMSLFTKQTPSDVSNAIHSFKHALTLDPDHSQAEAALANAYLYGYVMHWPTVTGLKWPSDALERARTHAQNALLMENSPALSHTVLARARFFGSNHSTRYDDALTLARRAFVLDPDDPAAYLGLAEIFIYGGEPDRAIAHLGLAQKLDPYHSGAADYFLALAYFHMERFADAAAHVEIALRRNPDAYSVWALSSAIYSYLGRQQEAILAINHARYLSQRQGVGTITAALTPGYMSYTRSIDRARLRHGLNVACFLIGVKLSD